jgi:hypothetical protein
MDAAALTVCQYQCVAWHFLFKNIGCDPRKILFGWKKIPGGGGGGGGGWVEGQLLWLPPIGLKQFQYPDAKFPRFHPGLPSASLFMCGVLKAGGSGGVGGKLFWIRCCRPSIAC